ncbi:GNAT family N-acetyltransferase [Sphingomonas japonica]|uniref:Ribosomal protein S18 acetylase RimI-like enzyme n=1 Tax=Sphingomonas japonica TaxID=511662 RepID=A0ABX0TY59_9SPHN|nr:GNAT family N-acetyltransferase [Sphingomonas japonica]NIJ23255.1 ribosomal protein S18 acetylase RimI-like enzyme [Sphingomonas japonica]
MIAYRDALPADAPALVDLARTSFTETFGHLYRPEDLAAFLAGHTRERWTAELTDPAYAIRIGEAGGQAVAYAKLAPPSLPVEPQGPAIELRQFYLLKPFHGAGHADALMRWVLDTARARGAHELFLSVFVDNHRARRFYERYGFEEIGVYAFMVGSHADEDHLMRLAL